MPNTKKNKEKKQNVLTCKIPGLPYPMDLVFPPGKLSVCAKCKKIYKTRRLCRERDGHTSFPWNKTYITFDLDESCFEEDADGKERIVRNTDSTKYEFIAEHIECSPTKYFAIFNPQADQLDPICHPCKLKNYTRTHCRVKHKHQNLPWGTVYMSLKAKKVNVEGDENDEPSVSDEASSGSKRKLEGSSDKNSTKKKLKLEGKVNEQYTETNDLGRSHLYSESRGESKAFLLMLFNNTVTLEWLSTEENIIVTEDVTNSPAQICVTTTEEESKNDDFPGNGNQMEPDRNEWPIPPLGSLQSFGSEHSQLPSSVNDGQTFDWYSHQQQSYRQNHGHHHGFNPDSNPYAHSGPEHYPYDQRQGPGMNAPNDMHHPHFQHPQNYSNPVIYPNQRDHYQLQQEYHPQQHQQYPQYQHFHNHYQQFPPSSQYQGGYPPENEFYHYQGQGPPSVYEDRGEYPANNSHMQQHQQYYHDNHYHHMNPNVVSPAGMSSRSKGRISNQVSRDEGDGNSSTRGYPQSGQHYI